jgi:hypothetical protein
MMTQDELDIWARDLAERINNAPNEELMELLAEVNEFTKQFSIIYNGGE